MRLIALFLLASLPLAARAQEPVPTPPPQGTPAPEGQPTPEPTPPPEPGAELPVEAADYGRFNVGAFWLTPSLRIGNVTYDSNVLYQPTGLRQSDIIASAGPGLLTVLPIGLNGRFNVDGQVQYIYFHKTVDKRRFNTTVAGSLIFDTTRTQFDLTERWMRTNSRPDPEVDQYLLRDIEGTDLHLRRQIAGPWYFSILGSRLRTRVIDEELFLGNDLNANLTRDKYVAGGELEYALTVKTSLVGGGDHQWDRFPKAPSRNGEWDRYYGGIRIISETLLSGEALVGTRRFTRDDDNQGVQRLYVRSHFQLAYSPRTSITALYTKDFDYSAYTTTGDTQTNQHDIIGAGINKELGSRVDIQLFGNYNKLLSDGAVTIVLPDGTVQTGVRDEHYWRYGGNLGYYIREDLRAGVEVSYSQRTSTVDYFGVQGLNFGITVTYAPPQPSY
jgi:hypothetical protein